MKPVHYRKLNSGEWGLRVETDDPFEDLPGEGTEVTVTKKKDGTTSQQVLGNRVWEGEEEDGSKVGLYSIVKDW